MFKMSVQVDTVWCQSLAPAKQNFCMFLYYLGSRTLSLLHSSGSVQINRIPFFTDLDSVHTGSSAEEGYGKQDRKPDPE